MKTYVVHESEYMFDPPRMYVIKAKDDITALQNFFEWDEDEYREEYGDWPNFLKAMDAGNGDGMPYMTIFSVEDNKIIYGGDAYDKK